MTQQAPILADLHKVRPAIYWADLLTSAAIGWGAFAVASAKPFGSAAGLAAMIVAVFALYRALAFTHEISHQAHRIPGFETAWNRLVGFPLLLPSFMYAEAHFDHHRVATYGTKNDPEYLPFARSALMTAGYAAQTLFIPLLLCVRFFVLAPIAFVSRPLERWLVERASSIAINRDYRRPVTDKLLRAVRRDTLMLLAFWAALFALGIAGVIPARAAIIWLAVTSAITFIDGLRTLAAHEYESAGEQMDKSAQAADSIDIPGRIWTELWAPVGLRYHATHHCYPGVPYHALPAAYRRLVATTEHADMTQRGLIRTLRALWRKGMSVQDSDHRAHQARGERA